MTKYLIVICVGIVMVWAFLWSPGGLLNPHDWISDHYKLPDCQGLADYICTDKSEPAPTGFKGGQRAFVPFHLVFSDIRKPRQFPDGCWDIDFCTRHSEARVKACGQK